MSPIEAWVWIKDVKDRDNYLSEVHNSNILLILDYKE